MEDGPVTSERTIAGRYAILREIGRGGMATVCVARDLESGSLVAIKMLREDIASSVNTERFLREVGVAGTLDHPRISAPARLGAVGRRTPLLCHAARSTEAASR